MDKNGVIGNNGSIPWNLPKDLEFFKKMTLGQKVIMGRKTYDSLPAKKLPDRKMIILNRFIEEFDNKHAVNARYTKRLTEEDRKDAWIIGGAEIYKMFYKECADLFVTHVKQNYEGDTYFPYDWKNYFVQHQVIEENNDFKIVHYKNRQTSFNETK